MNRQIHVSIAMVILAGVMAMAAPAQSHRIPLRASIPFQFNVGNRTMPAGEYLVWAVSDDSSNVALKIQSQDGKASAMLLMRTVEGKVPESAKLLFNRYGNQYFFSQAWVDGDKTGLQTSKSRAERAAQRDLAAIKAPTESVALRTRR
jgi:hypothetical protein